MSERRNGGGRRDVDRVIWDAFSWAEYLKDTGHLTMLEHGAYMLLMGNYYLMRRPLPASVEQVLRMCRAYGDPEKVAIEYILQQFFYVDGDVYRHRRIDYELKESLNRMKRNRVAGSKGGQASAAARAQATVEQPSTEGEGEREGDIKPKSKALRTSVRAHFEAPSLGEVRAYCQERGNLVDPEKWFNHYTSNGWKVGRNSMKDWRAAVRTWEHNGSNGNDESRTFARRQSIAAAARDVFGPDFGQPADLLPGEAGADGERGVAGRLELTAGRSRKAAAGKGD